jgi:hypothetical protein
MLIFEWSWMSWGHIPEYSPMLQWKPLIGKLLHVSCARYVSIWAKVPIQAEAGPKLVEQLSLTGLRRPYL